MSYLIQQMWLCLLLAALLGALIGWWLAKSSCRNKLDDLDASWRRKLDDQERDHSRKLKDASTPAAAGTAVSMISMAEQTSYEVEEVEGIGKSYGQKLRDIGISTTEQLLNQCCNMNGRVTVAEHVGIEDFVVRKWASMSDLMRLSGVEGQFSELMVYAGIDSVQDLGQQSAGALHNKLSTTNDQQKRVKTIPDESSLELMISQAKSLKAIMQDA
ncbi:MAG: DUF4332 domain-containing protein [Gammaproteobacteria bacterium]|nr:DUF4332 domain-containing protein [Gammaproteobacteria bacterium]